MDRKQEVQSEIDKFNAEVKYKPDTTVKLSLYANACRNMIYALEGISSAPDKLQVIAERYPEFEFVALIPFIIFDKLNNIRLNPEKPTKILYLLEDFEKEFPSKVLDWEDWDSIFPDNVIIFDEAEFLTVEAVWQFVKKQRSSE